MKLSENLTLAEACVTNSGLPNTPNLAEMQNLEVVAKRIFQPCRDHFGKPLRVNSGFRSQAVNKAVGGAATSQHTKGEALDLDFGNEKDNKALFDFIHENLDFDQLINEFNYSWIHVSYSGRNRGQVLKAVKQGGKTVYNSIP